MITPMPTPTPYIERSITIERDIPLASFTTFGIGGPARFLVRAGSVEEIGAAIAFARREGLPFCVLGGGSNLLVGDRGFDGVAIRIQTKGIRVRGPSVEVQAGVELMALVRHTARWGLSGLERLAGIPGLVGGAVRGNAGAYGSCMADVVVKVLALDAESLEVTSLSREECAFAYRNSRFKENRDLVVLAAVLELSQEKSAEVGRKVEETIRRREARQLQCDRSAGSFFMNPVVTDRELIRRYESEQGTQCRECRVPAGWLIDQARLRSLRVGDAMVSPKHANYLVNAGSATAEEMVSLARLVQSRVLASLGVRLREEVSCLGVTLDPEPQPS